MALKTLTYVVQDEGRDQGKHFLLTEMPARPAQLWAIRALLAIAKGGVDIPDDFQQLGFAGLARIGLTQLFKVPFGEAVVLLDDLMECVQIIPSANNPSIRRALVDSDVEEITTRTKLQWEVLKLHVDFSKAAASSTSAPAASTSRAA